MLSWVDISLELLLSSSISSPSVSFEVIYIFLCSFSLQSLVDEIYSVLPLDRIWLQSL